LALYSSISKYVQHSGVKNWPHVRGTVIFSGVAEQTHYNRKRNSTFSPRTSKRYVQRIKYTYLVNNSQYVGINFNLNDSRSLFNGTSRTFSNKETAQQAARRFSKGTSVDVYYSPDNPEIASLSHSNASILPIIAAVGFLGFSILALLIALEKINPANLPWRKNA